MKIPRNFDRWMFDYKEGNLSGSEMDYFENFMAENPQLNADINAWNDSYIPKQEIVYQGMANLQKSNKFAGWYGWSASITLLIMISIGGYFITTNNHSKLYNLRDFNYTGVSYPSVISSFNLNLKQSNTAVAIQYSTSNSNLNSNNSDLKLIGNSRFTKEITKNNSQYNLNETNHKDYKSFLLDDEINKIESYSTKNKHSYSASYQLNPNFKVGKPRFDVKSKSKYGTLGYKVKKVIRKIEKMSGYPVGLTNLKDPDLLIPNSNSLDFNAGFVGGFGAPRLEMRYRNQWMGHQNNLQSSIISFDTYSKSLRGGFGVVLNSNNFNNGSFTDNRVSLFYSPKFAVNSKIYFEPSIKMTLGLMTMNTSKINANSMLEIERGRIINTFPSNDLPIANNLWYKDYGLGFIINADKFYMGFQADNLAKHKQSIYGKNVTASVAYTAIIGMDYQSRNKKMTLSPFVSYFNNSIQNEIWGGINMKYQSFTFGGSYSSQNEFSTSFGLKFKTFKLIYQYDRTKSYLADELISSHTIGLRMNTKRKKLR